MFLTKNCSTSLELTCRNYMDCVTVLLARCLTLKNLLAYTHRLDLNDDSKFTHESLTDIAK